MIYKDESGAINEAMSDIFAAMVDREDGATEKEIWQIGEDVYIEDGRAMRSMRSPAGFYCYHSVVCRDYYPDRYTDTGECKFIFKLWYVL